MGGTDNPSNLIELTVEEHALAHKKLFEEYGRWQDEVAWQALSGQIGNEEATRTASSLANLGNTNGRGGKGKKLSEETKKRIGLASKGRKHTEETKKKISLAHKGMKRTEETKKNISLAKKRYWSEKRPLY